MLASVDVPIGRTIVIDNGGHADVPGAHVIRMPINFGIGASWNLAMKVTPDAPWWAHINDDVVFAPGDLDAFVTAMDTEQARVVTLQGFSAFGINRAAVERVGWFDENFHPAYLEDCDYEYRCKLADVPIVKVKARLTHAASSTIADRFYGDQNRRTYQRNFDWYTAKWGGTARRGERFTEPWDGERDNRLSIERLADLAWTVKE
ncbi:MAG TPA: glycosyltransferase [Gemmatimonadales bacterium]|nr:glycosyltransferase [Gemmatimonadales bacterium]